MRAKVTKQFHILGVKVDGLTLEEGLAAAASAMTAGPAAYITLPYVEFVMRARQNSQIRAVLNNSQLSLPNGVALNWAVEYLEGGRPGLGRLIVTLLAIVVKPRAVHRLLPDRFDSSNFTWPLLETAARLDLKVFLIGSPRQATIEATAKHLAQQIDNLEIVGTFPGYFRPAGEIQLVERLEQSRPDLILVGIGFPQQELLMQRLAAQLPHGLLIGEGGSFDYEQFGGRIKRAPRWLRRAGLEWLWRLIREPRRLGRQLAIPKFIWAVYRAGQAQARS